MKFEKLIENICLVNAGLQQKTTLTINHNLIIRNWLFGFYMVEFEQNGKDYAQYGERLLYRIAEELKDAGLKGVSYTNLTLFRKFFLYYPQMAAMSQQVSPYLDGKIVIQNLQTPSEDFKKWSLPPEKLLSHLSYSHFTHLLKLENSIKRFFYEIECIKGNWSSRQLQRQIGSLLYERTGLSENKEKLLENTLEKIPSTVSPADIIRDPYVFEFLGLKPKEIFYEKDLEKALLDHLQNFLLELGTGFCLEARQKSFSIDGKRYKVDLVFYHRVLKCQVLIDLKMRSFSHEDAGQMNFYLNYFKENELLENDNPPVGIVLCTLKNETVVRYATGGLNNQIFVSRYLLRLPSEQVLQEFILKEMNELGDVT